MKRRKFTARQEAILKASEDPRYGCLVVDWPEEEERHEEEEPPGLFHMTRLALQALFSPVAVCR